VAKLGATKHLKRLAAPPSWPIKRKAHVFTVKPSPGPHPISSSLPLLILVRDILGFADTAMEAKKIIKKGRVKVDGVVRRDHRFPVGLMDVVELADTGCYRIFIDRKRCLFPYSISEKEAGFKVCKIVKKNILKGGVFAYSFHDGRVLRPPAEINLPLYGSVKLEIPNSKVLEHLPLSPGVSVMITGGSKAGLFGKVKNLGDGSTPISRRLLEIESENVSVFIPMSLVMVIGGEKPWISLPSL